MQFLTELLKKFPDIDKEKAQNYINFCLSHVFVGEHEKYRVERHHILPKNEECFPEFIKDEENIVPLSYKDHYIAHALLADFLDVKSVTYSWIAMNNMNSKRFNENMDLNISAELYETLKNKAAKMNSKKFKGKTVGLIDGKYRAVDCETYHKLSLKSPFKGRVNVLDIRTGEKYWVSSSEYNPAFHQRPSNGIVYCVEKKTYKHVGLPKDYYDIHKDEYWHMNKKVNGVFARDLAKLNNVEEKNS